MILTMTVSFAELASANVVGYNTVTIEKRKKKMKKLVIAAIAVAFAAATQAATVAWGAAVADPTDPTGSTPATAGHVAYLLYSSTGLGSMATTLNGTGIGATANNGGTVVSTYTLTSDDVDMWAFWSVYGGDGVTVDGSYQILIVDEANNRFGVVDQTFNIAGVTDTSSPGYVTYNSDASLGFDKFAGSTGWTGTVAVPEPTSGLLMLVGLAGLALRRRRA
jgi:hypothetical protein